MSKCTLVLLVWFTLFPCAFANSDRVKLKKDFTSKKCTYLIDPSIRTKISPSEYEVISHRPIFINSESFSAAGDPNETRVILVTSKTFSSTGKIPQMVVKSKGSRKVKLANGFEDFIFEVHEDTECSSIFNKALEISKREMESEAKKEAEAKTLRDAEDQKKTEQIKKSQSIKESKSKALYE